MMLRILAYALNADELLQFGKGLSQADEPDLVLESLDGRILKWIRLGLPDARELRQTCGRAASVLVVAYGGRAVPVWWSGVADEAARLSHLEVLEVPAEAAAALAALARRNADLQVTIQDGLIWVNVDDESPVELELRVLKPAGDKG